MPATLFLGLAVGCGTSWLTTPERVAATATIEPRTEADGRRTLATPSRAGAVALWGSRVAFSIPGGILGVPRSGGATTVVAELPSDCWPRSLATSAGALFVPCDDRILRITEADPAASTPVLEGGSLLHQVVAAPDGVYTCNGTRLVRLASDGESYVTLADLGVVPPEEGGAAAAACLGARISVLQEAILVDQGRRAWRVPLQGGAPEVFEGTLGLLPTRAGTLTRRGLPHRSSWFLDEHEVLSVADKGDCARATRAGMLGCTGRDQTELVHLDLSTLGGDTTPTAHPVHVSPRAIFSVDVDGSTVAWAEGDPTSAAEIWLAEIPEPRGSAGPPTDP
ncbi:MAG: hypothetical protein KTR31_08480 [Myxococcales bacterium]|nr:hypothetical protein [Myxococcales bacterium]